MASHVFWPQYGAKYTNRLQCQWDDGKSETWKMESSTIRIALFTIKIEFTVGTATAARIATRTQVGAASGGSSTLAYLRARAKAGTLTTTLTGLGQLYMLLSGWLHPGCLQVRFWRCCVCRSAGACQWTIWYAHLHVQTARLILLSCTEHVSALCFHTVMGSVLFAEKKTTARRTAQQPACREYALHLTFATKRGIQQL